ncbi:MAG: L-serine ammonia-lyase, iron-sulfur-dependent, subunit alpha [Lachnospiraceae bacterium]|nr:L-serine ammonia-lyase, iron-sulfur-dependent, subunit alpha [Lachnospiraceae bacterium]
MERNDKRYGCYVQILKEELVPAMGCTEPIALAYAAAKARELLGELPEKVVLQVSGSIIKNVKSVIVPGTNHWKGLEAAAAAGIIAGHAERELEVLSEVDDEERSAMSRYLDRVDITVEHIEEGHIFDIIVTEYAGEHYSKVRIADHHTEIVLMEKDGKVLYQKNTADGTGTDGGAAQAADRSLLTVEGIWDFANTCDLSDVEAVLDRQIRYNTAIAEEGLKGDYGANIGKVLLKSNGSDVRTRARAYAAAGSDARMNGCELPVIINSGSGNQGMTCSLPLIVYAEELGASREKLLRALIISNLISIHEKTGIGTLSAYCGAVSAGAGAGAGVAYLLGGDYQAIIHTVVNALAIVSGIICDGAKASCAAKIASSVDAGILGYEMYCCGQEFKAGDGIVMKGIEATIDSIGRLGKDGMRQTNDEIISLMIGE